MPNPKVKTLKVKDLKAMLREFKKQDMITDDTEVWLSSDEEGNDYSPLVKIDQQFNVGVEEDKSKVTFYPISM